MRPRAEWAVAWLTLFALGALSIDRTCGGWEPSPNARDACCATAGHDSHREAADACCASEEEHQQGQSSGTTPSLAPSSSELAVSIIDSLGSRSFPPLDDALDRSRSSTVTRLLNCVFLI